MAIDERSPITPDEYVLRLVPRNKNYIQLEIPIRVRRVAFEPRGPKSREPDLDGLSVYRELFTAADDMVAGRSMPRQNYCICRLLVADLYRLKLTVVPDPIPIGPRGHTLIREINYQGFISDRRRSRELQERLAELASESIVWIA